MPRHVVDRKEVAHLWYHKAQDNARNASKNFYFEGDTIYSYGGHFPIARHVENSKGEKAVLFTNRGYSNTTTRHIHIVRMAIPAGTTIFFVRNFDRAPNAQDVREKEQNAAENLAKASRARKCKADYIGWANGFLADAQRLIEFFGLDCQVQTPEGLQQEVERIAKEDAEQLERNRQVRKEREERLRKEAEERKQKALSELDGWKRGENDSWRVSNHLHFAYGRIVGSELVTSKGARVPVEHVKQVAKLVRGVIESGKTYKRNGHTIHLGHYPLDEITETGMLRAGCHYFEKDEVLRILDMCEKA